jgi:hypothetical protein
MNINTPAKSLNLATVVMPLVRVMADAQLSWAQREVISNAISQCHHQWSELEKERQLHTQAAAYGQQGNISIQARQQNSPTNNIG